MISPQKNRVVVTGIGVVAPNGIGKEAFWETLVSGKSGIKPITRFDASKLRCQIAGEVSGFEANTFVPSRLKPKRLPLHTQFAVAAMSMALKDAKLDPATDLNNIESGLPVVVGIGSSSFEMIASDGALIASNGPKCANPLVIAEATPNSVGAALSKFLEVPTRCSTFATACAAGLDAIAEGFEKIKNDEAEIVIAGAAETPIAMVPMANFDNAKMCSRQNENPARASRPFDIKRDSGVISEGGCIVILENIEHAIARGIDPYLEISGYATYNDPPSTEPGIGLEQSMRIAMANSGTLSQDVDYICAWAPSHPVMDRIETEMIKKVFKEHAYKIPVTSIKGVIGNPLSAAGPLMLAACCLTVRNNLVTPTANYEYPDPSCDLDYVPGRARHFNGKTILLNAHGVGGSNSTMIVRRLNL